MSKFIFVTGGVVSGIGKGISAASIGRLLIDRGLSVFMQKFDPYLNVDPGLMSPYQHGEVFVTKDGAKTDLDLGHYERFIDVELTQKSSVTSGRIYDSVLKKEKRGDYNGRTVQVIPHVTDEIKKAVYDAEKESGADIIITEIGGTVGDIESLPFIEAIRQIHAENPRDDVLFIHATLVPQIPGTTELKTKPTQHSHKELMGYGIKADMIIARSDALITDDIKAKISMFTDVPKEAVVQSKNVELIYEVPLTLKEEGVDEYILKSLNITDVEEPTSKWEDMVVRFKNAKMPLSIGLVGKYTELPDSYISVLNALKDSGYDEGYRVDVKLINTEEITEENIEEKLKDFDGIIVPNGAGKRGTEELILTIKYARENNIPFFGIGLGMDLAVVEYGRNVLGLEGASMTEIDNNTEYPVIDYRDKDSTGLDIERQERLGNYTAKLKEGSKAHELYGEDVIVERHRHRQEFNNDYREIYEENGMVFSGIHEELDLVEIIELPENDFFIATISNPEFRHRPNRVHPLFHGFIKAAGKYSAQN